ncbi:MAG TPA: DUF5597 domain-containing protein, partial [bacterium]|nr:DUF5597 domain-containing protein [bacterium]
WHYARYIGRVTAAGKEEYPLPMYVNAWLVQNDNQLPGDYPSGGPVARMLDVWRAGAPVIDFFAPDIYLQDFKGVTARYTRAGNPLMIPEARRGEEAARNAFWAFAEQDALCFAPFGIESIDMDHTLIESYRLLMDLRPILLQYQGSGKMYGILQQEGETDREIEFSTYTAHIHFQPQSPETTPGFGLIIEVAPDTFLIAGNYFSVGYSTRPGGASKAGLLEVWEGRFDDGQWVPGRCLNGDETAGGDRVQLPPNSWDHYADPEKLRILRTQVYSYE